MWIHWHLRLDLFQLVERAAFGIAGHVVQVREAYNEPSRDSAVHPNFSTQFQSSNGILALDVPNHSVELRAFQINKKNY